MTPVRVLHVIDSMNPGGAQRALLHLIRAMDPERFACDVAVLHGPGPVTAEFAQHGIAPVHLARTKWDPRIPWRLGRLIRSQRYDVVHAHMVPSGFLCEELRKLYAIPRLVVHVQILYRFHEKQRYQNLLEPLMYRRADRVIACSRSVLDSIPRARRAVVVYNSLGEDELAALAACPAQNDARRVLDLPAGAPVIGTVARISPNKNHLMLCHLAAALAPRLKGLTVLFVGSGPEEPAVRALAERLGIANRVIITGYRPDVRPYLAAMDAYVTASLAEGLPVAVIEAMAARKACVLPDCPWAHETGGDSAVYFDPRDMDSLIGQTARVLTDAPLRETLGSAAQARARQLFSARRMAQDVAAVYEEIISS